MNRLLSTPIYAALLIGCLLVSGCNKTAEAADISPEFQPAAKFAIDLVDEMGIGRISSASAKEAVYRADSLARSQREREIVDDIEKAEVLTELSFLDYPNGKKAKRDIDVAIQCRMRAWALLNRVEHVTTNVCPTSQGPSTPK